MQRRSHTQKDILVLWRRADTGKRAKGRRGQCGDGSMHVCLCRQVQLQHERLELVQTTAALSVASLWAASPLAHTSVGCSIISCLDTHGNQYRKSLAFASCTTHSRPCCKFRPVMALQVIMCHLCVLMASSRSPCTPSALARQQVSASRAVAHLAYLVLAHRARHVALVFEDKQAGARETLRLSVR